MWFLGFVVGTVGAGAIGYSMGAYPDASSLPGVAFLGIIMLIAGAIVIGSDTLH